jgi:hypothetical protein
MMYRLKGRKVLRVALIPTSSGLRWATCYREYWAGPLKRFRSKYLPPRMSRFEAEADLRAWAEERGLEEIDDR